MAIKLGIVGDYNTGKSFSRTFIKNGENAFIIMPSAKAPHLTDSKGKPVKRLQVSTSNSKSLEEIRDTLKLKRIGDVIPKLLSKSKEELTISGNFIRTRLHNLDGTLQFVNKYMPHIKTIFIPDITHYVSSVIADKEFIKRKSGGEAFQRFWELAGEVLSSVIESIDTLREDLIVVTEYHCEYDENAESWKIFMPGGKMVVEKFKLDSYYDYMLYTYVNLGEDGIVNENSYKFVTRRYKHYNARMAELFKDTFIPNNLEVVLNKMREVNGI